DRREEPGTEARWDWHSPLGSLPRWLRRKRSDFPANGAYLVPDPARRARWRARLDALGPEPTIGLCWRSGLLTPDRRRHYAPLTAWARLLAVPGVTWICLQYDECGDELATFEQLAGIRIHRWPDEDLKNDLESVAALVAELDGIVTAPTAISSLAGAVGARTWQVDSGSDWTIGGERASPWFPTVEVVPRRLPESWDAVMDRVAGGIRSSLLGRAEPG
ncbi:MAG: N-acetylglucosaminyltransferase, partial [Gemmatimonadota bacterium]